MRAIGLGSVFALALLTMVTASAPVSAQIEERLIGGGDGITVFEDRNFRGDAATYRGNMSNLPSRFNNRISSVRVGAGEQWEVCDLPNYRGQCVTISGEERDLGMNDWDNRISSMRRLRGDGGGWNPPGGGSGQRPPNWAVGTFYSAYPAVTLTIGANGQVQSNIGGQIYYGRYTNGGIRADGDGSFSTVSRLSNGIRTYNRNTGQTIDFTRNWGGGGGNGNWEGPTSAPPSWAVGTFVTNSGIRMSIDRSGRVTSLVSGQTYYGRYYYGNIYDQNGGVASVSRDGNGIRTYNRSTNEYLNFRRISR